MEIKKIQCNKRFKKTAEIPVGKKQYEIDDFTKDYMSIISNSIVRRLQDKTQVFPLDKNDFIRTRLTHSLEVSSIAQQLGIMLKKHNIIIEHAPMILQCAGLLHDLGNPPFGHFGEVVIRDWFKNNLPKIKYKGKPISEVLSDREKADLLNFEGNAQTFRLLTKIYKNQNGNNLNLTFSIISTLIKYPVSSLEINSADSNIKKHKLGYFYAEDKQMKLISEEVGTISNSEYVRHPLTYLLEAADDIAYATSDLEDAYKKKLFTIDQLLVFLKQFTGDRYYSECVDLLEKLQKENRNSEFSTFHDWIINIKWRLMYSAMFRFSSKYEEIMKGTYEKDLFYKTFQGDTLKMLKQASYEFAFNSKNVLKLELTGKTIIDDLLDKFVNAVIHYDCNDVKQNKTDKKYISLISKDFINDYLLYKQDLSESYNLYLRILMVLDYISSMTDSYIKDLYKELNGID